MFSYGFACCGEAAPRDGEKRAVEDKSTTGKARACGRAGRPHATAGSASWAPATVLLSTLCRFSNFMKKKGRGGTTGGGIAGEHCSSDPWRRRNWSGGGAGLVGLGGGKEDGNGEGRRETGVGSGRGLAGWQWIL